MIVSNAERLQKLKKITMASVLITLVGRDGNGEVYSDGHDCQARLCVLCTLYICLVHKIRALDQSAVHEPNPRGISY
jgi:hypothetical protein